MADLGLDRPDGWATLVRAEANAVDFESVEWQLSKFSLYDPLAMLAAMSKRSAGLDQGPTIGEGLDVGAGNPSAQPVGASDR